MEKCDCIVYCTTTLVSECLPANDGDSGAWTSVDDCVWVDGDTPAQ